MGAALQGVGQLYAEKYLAPFTTGIGAELNSGFMGGYNPSEYSKFPIFPHVYAGVKFCGLLLDQSDKYFNLAYTSKAKINFGAYGDREVDVLYSIYNAPTVFGGPKVPMTGTYQNPITGQTETIQSETLPGIADTRFQFLAIPQIGIGTLLGTDVTFRTIPGISVNNYGSFKLFGVALRHSLGAYIKSMPFDLSVQLGYQNFGITDNSNTKIISANTEFANVMIYKSFPIISIYLGGQFENYSVNVNYSFVNPYTGSVQTIGFNQVGDNSFRAVVGGNIKVGPAIFNADVNIGSKTVFTSGLGVTL
jgi:hypothetical protein